MRSTYILLLLAATIMLSCNKEKEVVANKCQNGGAPKADTCACPWGYEGEYCEMAISEYLTGTYIGRYTYNKAFTREVKLIIEKHLNPDKAPAGITTFFVDNIGDFYYNDATVTSKTDFSFNHNSDTLTLTISGRLIEDDSITMTVIQTTPTGNDHHVVFTGIKQ